MHSLYGSPKHLRFENVHFALQLTVDGIIHVEFKGYISQKVLSLSSITSLTIEDSQLTNVTFNASMSKTDQSITIKNSSLINEDTMLHLDYSTGSKAVKVELFIEHTDFKFTPAPSPNQPPYTIISFGDVSTVNATISKCKFFNYNSTALVVDVPYHLSTKDVYLNMCQIFIIIMGVNS